MSKIKLKRKLQASTLVESIVALILLSISVSMGMMTYFNIMRSDRAKIKMEAKSEVELMAEDTKQKQSWIDEEVEKGKYVIKRVVGTYPEYRGVYLMDISAIDKRKTVLYHYRELIYSE